MTLRRARTEQSVARNLGAFAEQAMRRCWCRSGKTPDDETQLARRQELRCA